MPKNIVVCCDGTGNEYGPHNTNVVLLFDAIEKNTSEQIGYYDPGIGTFNFLGRYLGNRIGALFGQAFGFGLTKNIEDAYYYLMNRFEDGDKVFLFGFSRGAYTVRALAGMLYKCGLLQKGSDNLIEYASRVYNTRGNDDIARGFKNTYSRECKPHCIGVWDTVGALGWLLSKRFFDARLNPDVRFGYHAIAIDERRRKFFHSAWDETRAVQGQTIVQVWFPGVHSDVGGWYTERGLSNGGLLWMLNAAEDCGLRVNADKKAEIVPDPGDQMHDSYVGFWKLLGQARREIPEGAKIHKSVFDRQQRHPNYGPRLPTKYTVVPSSEAE